MSIQSLSIVVPTKKCVNTCKFCVSRMRCHTYTNRMEDTNPRYDLYLREYLRKLNYARDNGCNTVMLTGMGEPQQNRSFLNAFGIYMMLMEKPFRNIEIQMTGVMMDDNYLRILRNHVGVNTISISLSSFNNELNRDIHVTPHNLMVDIPALCEKILSYDFTLRLSVNLQDGMPKDPEVLFNRCSALGASQVILREMYTSGSECEQDTWIAEHGFKEEEVKVFHDYILQYGRPLEILEYGRTRYSLHGMSVVLDNDCMSTEVKKDIRYLILAPDCKVYTKWDDPASLLF